MKNKDVKNIPASVLERLKNIAKMNRVDFNYIARRYVQERFLYRLSQSAQRDHFILKGALLFLVWDINPNRPTKDIDFLGNYMKNNPEEILPRIAEVLAVTYPDGVTFIADQITYETIKQDADYQGLRITIPCFIGTMKIPLQMDIGFGDIIVNQPDSMDFPVLLDFPAPKLVTYSVESSLAEKFQAIVSLGEFNSRIKDFYDIYYTAGKRSFSGEILSKALQATFTNRGTELASSSNIFTAEFRQSERFALLWKAFCRQRNLEESITFEEVVDRLEKFLLPVVQGEVHEGSFWHPEKIQWETEN